jgi:ABC-2 type transport system permease protein
MAVVWIERGAPAWSAILGAVLSVVVAVLLARVCMGLSSLALRERRSRELSGLFLLAIVVVVVPAAVFVTSLEWRGQVPGQLMSAVTVLGYTPFGAAWAIPGAVGGAASAAGTILVALVTVAGLWLLWVWIVGLMTSTAERPVAVRERGGLGWFGVAPGMPFGAIAARSLVYWLRDRRYLANAVIIPIAAALATVPLLIAGVPENIVALIPVPIMALLFGWLPHNDVAYDSTAVWMHVASGTDGLSDRLGRLVPVILMAVPLLAVLIPVSIVLYDRWALLPALVGVAGALFLSGLGLSSISSVVAPYPASQPGDSAFQQPQRSGSTGFVAQAVVLLGAIAAAAPALWWSWLALTRDIRYAMSALWGGLAMGVAVFLIGVAIGALLFRRRGARLMEFAEAA